MAPTALDAAVSLLDRLILELEEGLAVGEQPSSRQEAHISSKNDVPAVALRVPHPGVPSNPKAATPAPDSNLKKTKTAKPGKGGVKEPAAGGKEVNENDENFSKSLLQVAIVKEIEAHSNSDKLYVCKVEIAPGEVCQVITGLQKFYRAEELANRKVVIIKNLKPAKLAGSLSEAMILAGSVPLPDGGEIVKVLDPPAESTIGERVYLEGGAPSESPAKQLSSKVWEKIVHLLSVQGGVATFGGKLLVCSAGVVVVPGLPDGAGIH